MKFKKISVTIEWENVLLAEMDRCRAMLKQLRGQILELNSKLSPPLEFDIAIAFNQEIVQAELITSELSKIFQTADPHIHIRLTPAAGLSYYELKNFGANQAEGEVVLLLDSDVIPEAGWLQNLLFAYDNLDPQKAVFFGNVYLDPSSLVGRAMALSWVFPLRKTNDAGLEEVNRFFANNVLIAKSLALRFPFPKMEKGATRGSCYQLSGILRDAGVKIYRQNSSQVSHPPPNGFSHFIIRGIAQGRDDLIASRAQKGKTWAGRELWREIRHFFRHAKDGFASTLRQWKKVNLTPLEIPLALAVTLGYCQCRLAGATLTRFFPGYMESRFRI